MFIKIENILIGTLLTIQISCIKKKDDTLTLPKTPYLGHELKMEGYYCVDEPNQKEHNILILFRNGIVMLPGAPENPDIYLEDFAKNHNRDIKRFWGLFVIDSIHKKIKVEYFEPKPSGRDHAMICAGDILNDTTFTLLDVKRSKDGSRYSEFKEIYHFRRYSPKPDSTNKFL